ncbi:glutathione S-transferase [Methylophaga sp. 42_25_T18]|nr:glutathione S-transferase [Methylophaga sp. 42_25_T18]OUR89206.1 glutathione S-transferase [Methylophaga sp. 42_8_T64]
MTATPLPVLYSFRRCPYAMRARLAIANSQIQVELREIVLRNKPQQLIDISPKATVPVLITSDDTVIDESLDIMRWVLDQNDPNNWYNSLTQSQRQLSLQLIANNDGDFKYYLDRYKYADRYPEFTQDYYRQQAVKTLAMLEQQLQHNGYLICSHLTLADMAILPFIRQFVFTDKAWFDQSPYPLIQAWLDEFIESDLFITIMPKFKQWQSGIKVTLFPPE